MKVLEKCPLCQTQLHIKRSYLSVTGDASKETPTKVYTNLEQICVNPRCQNFDSVVDTIRHLEYTGE